MENSKAEKTSNDEDKKERKINLQIAADAKILENEILPFLQEIHDFNGSPSKLLSWIHFVDCLMKMWSKFKDTPENQIILRAIRGKIVGEANVYLILKGTSLSWKCIKEDLKEHFMERFDLMTFTYKLLRLQRRKDSIEKFHSKIIHLRAMIVTCVQIDPEYKGHEDVIIKLNEEFALEVFIREVGSPMCYFLRAHKPKDLLDAYWFVVNF